MVNNEKPVSIAISGISGEIFSIDTCHNIIDYINLNSKKVNIVGDLSINGIITNYIIEDLSYRIQQLSTISAERLDIDIAQLSNLISDVSNIYQTVIDLSGLNISSTLDIIDASLSNIYEIIDDLSINGGSNGASSSEFNDLSANFHGLDASFSDIYQTVLDLSGLDISSALNIIDASLTTLNTSLNHLDASMNNIYQTVIDLSGLDISSALNIIDVSLATLDTTQTQTNIVLNDLGVNFYSLDTSFNNIYQTVIDLSNLDLSNTTTLIQSSDLCYNISQVGGDISGEAEDDNSGYSVSLSSDGTIIAIGAPNNDSSGSNAGHVRVYKYTDGSWIQLGLDIDGEAVNDGFGWSVSLSSNGLILAVGAPNNNGNGTNSGLIKIYQYINSAWSQMGEDIHGDLSGHQLGYSVALAADEFIVAGGAPYSAYTGISSGSVNVYKYTNNGEESEWDMISLPINGAQSGDESGKKGLSISSDGTIVAIGASNNDGNGIDSGHTRIYKYTDPSWNKLGEDIDGEAIGDLAGHGVSLSSNGTIVAIGAIYNDGNGTDSGHTRVYQYIDSSWNQLGEDIHGEAANDGAGWNVSLSSDGYTLAVSAIYNDNQSGHVRIYKYIDGSWNQIGTDIDGEAINDNLGHGLSLSSDGTTIAAGAPYNDGNGTNSGHVRVYNILGYHELVPIPAVLCNALVVNESITCNTMNVINNITCNDLDVSGLNISSKFFNLDTSFNSIYQTVIDLSSILIQQGIDLSYNITQVGGDVDGGENNFTGWPVAISSDGNIIAVTNSYDHNDQLNRYVQVYQYTDSSWNQLGANIVGATGYFISLSSNGDIIAIGSPFEGIGYVKVYQYTDGSWNQMGANIVGDTSGGGFSVSLSSNGYIVAISAYDHATVYQYTDGSWNQLGSNNVGHSSGERYAYVSLSSDGTIVAIGAPENDTETGCVKVYQLTDNSWNQLGANIIGEASGNQLGYVSLSSDGSILATGAKYNTVDSSSNTGHVKVYKYTDTSWNQLGANIIGEVTPNIGGIISLSADGTRLAIGSPDNDDNGTDSGRVKVYQYMDSTWNQIGANIVGESAGDIASYVVLSSNGLKLAIGVDYSETNITTPKHVQVYEILDISQPVLIPAILCNALVVNEKLMVGSDNVIEKIATLETTIETLKNALNELLNDAGKPAI